MVQVWQENVANFFEHETLSFEETALRSLTQLAGIYGGNYRTELTGVCCNI
jgi:hypothetical protein